MRSSLTAVITMVLALTLLPRAGAVQLLSEEKALQKVFGTTDVDKKEVRLSAAEADEIVAKLTEETDNHLPRGQEIRFHPNAAFYFPKDESKGAAVILDEPGKWGPIQFIIVLDRETAEVKDLEVMAYTEKRGRPIARNNFLRQFKGNKIDDPAIIGRGIRAISGATVSSWSAALVVRKAQLMYQKFYLDGEKTD